MTDKTLIKTIRIQSGVVLCSPMVKPKEPNSNSPAYHPLDKWCYKNALEAYESSFVKVTEKIIWNCSTPHKGLVLMEDGDYPAPDNCYMTVKEARCGCWANSAYGDCTCKGSRGKVCTVSFEPAVEEKTNSGISGGSDAYLDKFDFGDEDLKQQIKALTARNAEMEMWQRLQSKNHQKMVDDNAKLESQLAEKDARIKELEAWKESNMKLWQPILNYCQDSKNADRLGIKVGDSITKRILKILESKK